ncbi:MAG: NUDIX hydrolase [Pirellulales bacterium]|nr:NUDIX hydrolase [Pirellulales bacterium]
MAEPAEPEVLLDAKRFQVVRKYQRTPSGERLARQIIRHPGAVVVLPLLEGDRVVLIDNYRIAVDEMLLELPAGTLEPNEAPLETAHRELAEETGYRAGSMELLVRFASSPGILSEQMHLFLATGLTAGEMALEKGEEIRPKIVAWDDALAMAADGRIRDAKTLVGILFYETFRRQRGVAGEVG